MSGFFLENFGCRATQADGAAIEQQLLQLGWARTPDARYAQVAVLNTCTVTAAADADARTAIRKIHRDNPGCKIMVTGCYAQRSPQELAELAGVTWVVGNSHKHQVAKLASAGLVTDDQLYLASNSSHSNSRSSGHSNGLAGLRDQYSADAQTAKHSSGFVTLGELSGQAHLPEASFPYVGDIFAHTELMASPVFESGARTRPNLKVQDGCDNRCSFCIIPSVRGQSRSLKLEAVLRECDALVAAGYREVVISGINLGRWGRDFPSPHRFENLVSAILERTAVERLRISSVEPMDWSQELIDRMASSPRMCKHAHVPLQSGSDLILRKMHRKYRPWHYADRIQRIHSKMPDAAIGADVMVGFPSETDALFEENLEFIRALPFTYLHVFTYSSRPGTAAAAIPNHVPENVKHERNRILRELIAEKNLAFRKSFVGKELEAITLHSRKEGVTDALSNNFIKLQIAGDHQPNQIVASHISGISNDGLKGILPA